MRSENPAVEAYPQRSIKRYVIYGILGLLFVLMIFNISSKDYKGTARDYLTEQVLFFFNLFLSFFFSLCVSDENRVERIRLIRSFPNHLVS